MAGIEQQAGGNATRRWTAGSRVRLRLASDDRLVGAIRDGDPVAFEVLYERHARELFSFCAYMLRSRHDAEDAVQATFASAYRALRADRRQVNVRPWLFAIARNACVSIQRRRRPTVELNGEPALGPGPARSLELKEEVRHVVAGLGKLPESQRTALVLTELHGLSQSEIAKVLDVRPEQVKAYVYQARSNLLSEKRARDADCCQIREELATARGATLLKGRLRRHVCACDGCRAYAGAVARQRRQLAALLPLVPSLLLRHRTLEDVLGIGAADPATYAGGAAVGAPVAGAAFEFAGGGIKALAVKVAAAVVAVGAGAGVGVSALVPQGGSASSPRSTAQSQRLSASVAARRGASAPAAGGRSRDGGGQAAAGTAGGQGSPLSGGLLVASTPVGDAPPAEGPTDGSLRAPGGEGAQPRGAGERIAKQPSGHGGKGAGAGGGATASKAVERKQTASELRARAAEERLRAREERLQAREQRERAIEEREQARAERERLREERDASRPPKSEEERKLLRERRELRREEREGEGGEEPPASEEPAAE